MSKVTDSLKIGAQYFLPKKMLSRLVGKLCSSSIKGITPLMIKGFIRCYHVDMSEAKICDIQSYKTFNDFFVRELKDGVRVFSLDKLSVLSTADGAISELGAIKKDAILQAKGHYYSLEALLAGDAQQAKEYENGCFVTTYLSPSDYHRVHMPLDGKLKKMVFVPGELFSVNPLTAENVAGLFAKNERVICFFENDEIGEFAVIMVGATIVASIKTVFAGVVAPSHGQEVTTYVYDKDNIVLKKGEELGCFLLGSTTICLFKKDKVKLNPHLKAKSVIKVKEKIAEIIKK